jgi:adenylate cyclase, class 2
MPKNYEFKARSTRNDVLSQLLLAQNALFQGIDFQQDTYFNVENGRLKLREGNIENQLIHYIRPNDPSAKISEVELCASPPDSNLKVLLTKALGVKVIVRKTRQIYFIDNVKFHLDEVEGLGQFMEIEAIDRDDSRSVESLKAQCDYYQSLLGVNAEDIVALSYSDMLLRNIDKGQ